MPTVINATTWRGKETNRLSGVNPLAYLGVDPSTPSNTSQETRPPTPHDYKGFNIGDFWLVKGTEQLWLLVGLSGDPLNIDRAWWTEIGTGGGGVDTFRTNGGDAQPLANVLNVLGGANITTNAIFGPPNTVTIALNNDVTIPGNFTVSSIGPGVVQADNTGLFFADNGGNGAILIGGGVAPAWANITSTDLSVTITNGANSIDLSVAGGGGFNGLIDDAAATAAPAGGKVTIAGSSVLQTTAAPANTITLGFNGGLDYEVISGVTATGIPVWKEVTSTGGSVAITDTGTTINLEAAGVGALTGLLGDAGPGATPDAGHDITLHGVNVITTDAGTVLHQVDIGLTDPGVDGQVVISSASGAPAWASLVAGSANITITPGANSITIDSPGSGFAGLVADDTNTAAPDGSNLINVIGDSVLTTTTAAVANTLTVSLTGGLDKQFIGGVTATGIPVWKELTSTGGTVTVTSTPTTINIEQSGGGASGASTFPTMSGTASQYGGVLYVYGGTNTNTSVSTTIPGNPNDTVVCDLNQVIYWPNTNAGGTTGVIYMGGNKFMHKMGTGNTFYGEMAGNFSLTVGSATYNTGIGLNSLTFLTTGHENTALGANSLASVTSAIRNVAAGVNSSGLMDEGSYNVSIGFNSMLNAKSNAPTTPRVTPRWNVAVGANSLYTMQAKDGNTALGYNSLNACVSDENTATGYISGQSVTSGTYNCIYGSQSARRLTTGNYNSAYGAQSLLWATTSSSNSAYGYKSGEDITTGSNNCLFGNNSGHSITTGSSNCIFGGTTCNTVGTGNIIAGNSSSTIVTGNYTITIGAANSTSNSIKIGKDNAAFGAPGAYEQSKCQIAGIYSRPVGATYAPVYIDNTGTLGTGGSAYIPAFLGIQTVNVPNAVGLATTRYYLGTSAALSTEYDAGSNFYPGSGAGAKCYFTAPYKGLYYLELKVCLSNIPSTPPAPPPAPTVVDPLYIDTRDGGGILQKSYRNVIPQITYQVSTYQTVWYATIVYMEANWTADFSLQVISPAGTNVLGVYGVVGSPVYTSVGGHFVAPIA